MSFKLYYSPASCGGAIYSYISASLTGLKFDSEQVSLETRKTASDADFYAINKKGSIPALVFDDGTMLTETVASFAWISSHATENTELQAPPPANTLAYFDFLDKLGYVNAEMHKAYTPLFFDKTMDEARRNKAKAKAVDKGLFFTENILGSKMFVAGDKPSVIDIYAYFVLSWSQYVGIDLKQANPAAAAFIDRMKALPQIAKLHDEMNAATAV